MGVLGDFRPLNVIVHHRDPPKGTCLRKSASAKLSTVKKPLRGLTCRRINRKCDGHTDRQTHTGKFIFCPRIALDRLLAICDFQGGDGWRARKSDNR